jgi:hypothetical protein
MRGIASVLLARVPKVRFSRSGIPACFSPRPILIFAILPAIWLFKWNQRRKLSPNACLGCGYDLTGNESGVCPECGVGEAKYDEADRKAD